jgi:hypothetical protein
MLDCSKTATGPPADSGAPCGEEAFPVCWPNALPLPAAADLAAKLRRGVAPNGPFPAGAGGAGVPKVNEVPLLAGGREAGAPNGPFPAGANGAAGVPKLNEVPLLAEEREAGASGAPLVED